MLFIGVTCGLSAPYVGGQLDFCLSQLDKFFPVLIGFNPAHQARSAFFFVWNKFGDIKLFDVCTCMLYFDACGDIMVYTVLFAVTFSRNVTDLHTMKWQEKTLRQQTKKAVILANDYIGNNGRHFSIN